MKFNSTRNLSFDEILHYADLGLIEGVELPTDFVGDIDSRIQRAFDLGREDTWTNRDMLLEEAYDEGFRDAQSEK